MKALLLIMVCVGLLQAEPFIQQEDKQKHIVGTALIGATATGLARYYGSSKIEAFAIGVASSLLIGVAKEFSDGHGYGTEDVKDVYADTIGGLVGSAISAQFSWEF